MFAAAILLSAFLLFLVQPMVAKRILPWFGGTPAVWTTCMLFFQVALLGGYAYAHWITTRFPPRRQAVAHVALLLIALLFLPIYPGAEFKPADPGRPATRILLLLGFTVLAPYFVLSATSPLLQRWFSLRRPGRSPYGLYAFSNAGSLLALPAYVVFFEPVMTGRGAALLWSAGFIGFAMLCGACAAGFWKAGGAAAPSPAGPLHETSAGASAAARLRPGAPTLHLWLLLPCAGSALLLAVTNQLCQDIAVMPFLWLLPLGLYLLSFILCFESDRWYRRRVFGPLAAALTALVVALLLEVWRAGFLAQVMVYGGVLFALCMVCHGELARLRPPPERLTAFYLTVSAGGALGAVFVALIAPLIFRSYLELHLALWGSCALGLLAAWRSGAGASRRAFGVALAGLAALGVALGWHVARAGRADVSVARNFYGVLRVKEIRLPDPDRQVFVLQHGGTIHGWQIASEPARPTAYYGPESGVGLALRLYPRRGGLSVGVVGLGVGTLAAYAQPGDRYRFYEINPSVVAAADRQFTFLSQCRAEYSVILGDARLSLEREPDGLFDILVLDAFSGDAVPAHLLTREAFEIYRSRLKPGGVIAANISNNYLDLAPVIRGSAAAVGMQARLIVSARDPGRVTYPAQWALLSADARFLDRPELRAAARPSPPDARALLWTDERNDLFRILRW